MIHCVVFDFDGTLVLSNEIKRDGFFAVSEPFPGGNALMEKLLADPPGDRFAIFRTFAAAVHADAAELADRYGLWCEEHILSCPERHGASDLLAWLRAHGLQIWINSATPQAPLRSVIEKRYPSGTFDGVLGGHNRKVENLRRISQTSTCPPQDMLMIGDGLDDYTAACTFGCPFRGVAEGSLEKSGRDITLYKSLSEIRNTIVPS